ncbi:MAG: alpha/beta fold hydrolase [Planctomycetota bacterium]
MTAASNERSGAHWRLRQLPEAGPQVAGRHVTSRQVASRQIASRQVASQAWLVEPASATPQATIVFVHGVCEHALRGLSLAQQLAAHGYATVLFDLPGHGATPQLAEDFAWLLDPYAAQDPAARVAAIAEHHQDSGNNDINARLHEQRYAELSALQLEHCFEQVRDLLSQLDTTPLFIAGHSLGGLIATCSAARALPGQLAGAILINPALGPRGRGVAAPAVALSWAARRRRWLAPLHLAFSALARVGPGVSVRWSSRFVSDIVTEQQTHALDPLILKKLPLSFLAEIERWMSWAQDQAATFPIPILVHAAEADPIVNTASARQFMAALPADLGTLHLYPGFAHDLSRSTAAEALHARTASWIEQRLRPLR